MKRFVLLFALLVVFDGWSQLSLLMQTIDTVKPSFKTGGEQIDSVDIFFTGRFTSLPGGHISSPFGKYQSDYSTFFNAITVQKPIYSNTKLVTSYLPHAGVAYSFGTAGIQTLHLNYQQTFRKNTLLNAGIDRSSSTGLFRYSKYVSTNLYVTVAHFSKHHMHYLNYTFGTYSRVLNGGIQSDSLIEKYGLSYVNVNKTNSQDSMKNHSLQSQHYFNLFSSDSLNKSGVFLKNNWNYSGRILREVGDLSTFYDKQIASDTIRDFSRYVRLENQLGVFLRRKLLKVEVGINRSYWTFTTLASQIRSEWDVKAGLQFSYKSLSLRYEGFQNLIGANNQLSHTVKLVKSTSILTHEVQCELSEMLPNPMQRKYVTATSMWHTQPMDLQGKKKLEYGLYSKNWCNLNVSIGYQSLVNMYLYTGNEWSNTLFPKINYFYVVANANFQVKNFYLQPRVSFNKCSSSIAYVPDWDIRSRIFWKNKLLKSNKLELIVGIDVVHRSNYQLVRFDDRVGVYAVGGYGSSMKTTQLDGFVSLSFDEFRFFFKVENIDYSWNNKLNRIAYDYPTTPRIMRLGLVWDFVN
jgi:hypothetical protein